MKVRDSSPVDRGDHVPGFDPRGEGGCFGHALARHICGCIRGHDALRDGSDLRRHVRQAEAAQDDRGEDDRDQEIHRGATEHNDELFRHAQGDEGAVTILSRVLARVPLLGLLAHLLKEPRRILADNVGVLALVRREHADHADVTA